MSKPHECSDEFERLAAEYDRHRQPPPTFDKETASQAAKLLNQGMPARQALDVCVKLGAQRKPPVDKASVEHSFKWLLQKKIAERNGGSDGRQRN